MNTFHFSTDWATSLLILASILLLILCFILFFVRRKREKTQPKVNSVSESVVRDQEEDLDPIEQSEKIPDEKPVQNILTEKVAQVEIIPLPPVSIKRGAVKPDFRKTFLHPTPFQRRGSVYLSMETKRRIHSVVQRIGEGNLTVTDYVENIMRHHLDLYRDEINRINRTRNFKDLV